MGILAHQAVLHLEAWDKLGSVGIELIELKVKTTQTNKSWDWAQWLVQQQLQRCSSPPSVRVVQSTNDGGTLKKETLFGQQMVNYEKTNWSRIQMEAM